MVWSRLALRFGRLFKIARERDASLVAGVQKVRSDLSRLLVNFGNSQVEMSTHVSVTIDQGNGQTFLLCFEWRRAARLTCVGRCDRRGRGRKTLGRRLDIFIRDCRHVAWVRVENFPFTPFVPLEGSLAADQCCVKGLYGGDLRSFASAPLIALRGDSALS